MASHTPGPWIVDPAYPGDIQTADGHEIASAFEAVHVGKRLTIQGSIPWSWPTQEANARLIASAPDMLAILTRAVQAHGPFGDDSRPKWWADACTIIARAEGRTSDEETV